MGTICSITQILGIISFQAKAKWPWPVGHPILVLSELNGRTDEAQDELSLKYIEIWELQILLRTYNLR